MDTKALAKSKRAHSLHHSKKHHPHQASKVTAITPGDKKPTVKQAKEKAPHSHDSRPLPSNWDRYDADLDLNSEDASLASSSQTAEVVVPKSKGADYAHLISEAMTQSQSRYPSETLPSFNDVIPDFMQDFGPVLAAKGQSMLSWIVDDNFEFEDKASTSFEVPFLTLNLNALGEQLANVKLSERLFLEPDLFLCEQLDDELQACGESKHGARPGVPAAVAPDSEVTSSESLSSPIVMTRDLPIQTEGPKSITIFEDEILSAPRTNSPSPVSKRVPDSIFQATNAEAELDMLLNSFAETTILDSSSSASIETVQKETQNVKIEDDIDNLLEETSDGRQTSHGIEESADQGSSKSKLLDDFDSWLDTI